MNTHKYYFAALYFLFQIPLFSCHKDSSTFIRGTVIDKHTGQPVDSAWIPIVHTEDIHLVTEIYSDSTGYFSYRGSNSDPINIYEVRKSGYLFKGIGGGVVDIKQEEINDVVIPIIPKDGMLRLNIENTLGVADTVYVAVFSPNQLAEARITEGVMLREKFDMTNLTHFQTDLALSSGEDVIVYWGFDPVPYSLEGYPFKESVTISKNAATAFTISF